MSQALVTTLVAMIDNLMVGQLGDAAISAVSISARILGIITFTIFGLVAATCVFIAQYHGAQNPRKQKEVFRISLIFSGVIFLLATIAMIFFNQQIIHFFVKDAVIEALAKDYIMLMLFSFVPFILSINYGTTLKVLGQVKLPLVASLAGVALNTTLNYLLIFGNGGLPKLGVSGAAIATICARILEFAIIYSFVRYHHYAFNTKFTERCHITKTTVMAVLKKALPLATNEVIWAIGMATILKLYATRGSEVIAAYAIADATNTIFFSVAQGVSAATPVFISQLLGANKFDEALSNAKSMIRLIFVLSFVCGLGMWGASYIVPNLFQVSATSHDLAVKMIRIMACMYWVYLVTVQTYYILRAGGDMKSTLFMDGGFMWLATIPAMAVVTYCTDASIFVIYLTGQSCDILKLLISQYLFRKKRWLVNLT